MAHAMGYRFRLHHRDLPGKPDLAFISKRKAIFVHGCFWHQHSDCREGRMPSSRLDYWIPKLTRNVERDRVNSDKLRALGWEVLVLWECELGDDQVLRDKLMNLLS